MHNTAFRFLCLAFAMLLTACTQFHYDLGEPLSESQIPNSAARIGLGEVLDKLGPPLRMSATHSGFVLAWEHWKIDENSLGFSLGVAGVDALSIDFGSSRTRGEFLLMGFDHQHQLTDSAFTRWDNHAGGGKSIQPFASLVSVVDVDDLLNQMPQHRWGAASLRELLLTLNLANQPDMGQSGIEQRGTPKAVGQRSLEMD
ncbi:MAG: hypothetical protein ACJASY_000460 [Halioglobus sp.]